MRRSSIMTESAVHFLEFHWAAGSALSCYFLNIQSCSPSVMWSLLSLMYEACLIRSVYVGLDSISFQWAYTCLNCKLVSFHIYGTIRCILMFVLIWNSICIEPCCKKLSSAMFWSLYVLCILPCLLFSNMVAELNSSLEYAGNKQVKYLVLSYCYLILYTRISYVKFSYSFL